MWAETQRLNYVELFYINSFIRITDSESDEVLCTLLLTRVIVDRKLPLPGYKKPLLSPSIVQRFYKNGNL